MAQDNPQREQIRKATARARCWPFYVCEEEIIVSSLNALTSRLSLFSFEAAGSTEEGKVFFWPAEFFGVSLWGPAARDGGAGKGWLKHDQGSERCARFPAPSEPEA